MTGPSATGLDGSRGAGGAGSLLEQAQQFLLVQRTLGVVTWVWDVEPVEHGRWYGDLSPLLGLPEGSFDNTLAHFVRCLHPDDAGPFESVFRDCLAGRRDSYRTEQRVVWPDGRWRCLETYGRAERDGNGRTVRMMGVIQDITERRRAELERQASQTRLQRLIDESPVAVGISQGDLVRYGNPRFLALFGFRDLAEAGGRTVGSLVAPAARAEHVERSRRRALGEPLPTTYVLRMCRVDGEEFDCEVSLAASAGPQAPDTLVFLQDVSERERARRALQELNAGLEQRVAERTRELAEARDAAEAATRAKSHFLANMSHEIRTPLNAIRGLGDLALRGTPPSARLHEYLTQIRRASDSLLLLVNDLLDFSRIESGRLEIEQRVFSLDELVDSVAAAVGLDAGRKGLEMTVDCAPALPDRLIGDPLRLGQVMLNLCANAVKFTERGSVQLRLRGARAARGMVRLRVVVVDTGIGIDPGQLPRLFRPFEQLDTATTRQQGGSGLGLAISRQLAELMGGTLQAHSRPGQGSRFELCLTLPAAEPALLPQPPQDRAPSVVAIEDQAVAGQALTHAFARLGWRGVVVPGVPQALAGMAAPTDLVLVSRRLRHDDADTAAARLRAAGWQSARLVRVLACGDEAGADRSVANGYDTTAAQPLTVPALRSLLPKSPDATPPSAPMPGALAGRRILLVEDNELNRLVATDLLTEVAGARVQVASSGEEALRLLAGPLPDVVLMDVQMPGLDGFQTTARLRADPRLARLPVVAMTAHATPADRQRCLDAGMDDFVSKPFEPEHLFQVLLRRLPAADDAVQAPPPPAGTAPGAVDFALGLRRCLGHSDLYRRVQQRFAAAHASDSDEARQALRDVDRERLARLAHRMVSSAGLLGAEALAATARELQDTAPLADEDWQALGARYLAQFDEVLLALPP
ncbi:MAG: response regulator [Rubrivivax sp.]|nr:response regulator [Rubrivivax sp.]